MKTLFNIFFALLFGFSFYAQNVGINSTGVAPDNSSMLDIVSTDKGVLVPRVNIIDLNTAAPVTAPANSLLVYNTNVTSGVGFYFWDGTKWTNLKDANSNSDEDWYEVGGTSSPDDINDNIFTQGNVGIGRLNPQIKFVVSEGNSANTSVALEGFNSGYAGLPTILPPTGSHFGGIVHGGTNGQLVLGIRENDVNDGLLITSGGGDYNSDNTYDNAILFARNDGNIGVSMIAPDERLHINGNLALDSYQLGVGNGIFFRDGFNSSSNPYNMSITSDTFDGGTTPDALSINGYEGVSISTGHNTVLQRRLTVVNNGNVGVNTISPTEKLDVVGNVSIGTHTGMKIHNSFGNSIGAGPRELFRVSNSSLSTGGLFTISATRGNFVHNSTWSWSSNHHTLGRGMLTQLSGSYYSDIRVYLDVNSSGDAILSADWGVAQGYSLSVVNMSGNDDLNVNSAGTDWTTPNGGYTRVSDVETKAYSFQTVNGLFSGNVGVGTVTPTSQLHVVGLLEFTDNAAALAGGLTIGAFYRTGDLLKVVH